VCGRFNLTASGEELAEAFGLDEPPELVPRYNIAPSQPVLIVQARARGREARPLRWGLGGDINARAETAAARPAFRDAFRTRRCLVPASGFYEWKRVRGQSTPFHVRPRGGGVLALAAIWGPQAASEEAGCVILTTEPNALVAAIHDRMPVIVPPEAYAQWLETPPDRIGELEPLLQAPRVGGLEAVAVTDFVNSTANDGPQCLVPGPSRARQGLLFPEMDE
jgi:putative SOS response-associated peptidase YedK